ncbi:hypothetical protein [Picosynechococcus sp. NKBG15041c]|uniref:hypothetical protein n=1 Tax=Picosynechococcus sp. NKBG15041c TaxID=1407650 RepID=UPI000407F503|nr:hypothetical protein [Picosynechococcus sp. NKBG15041c]
MSKTNQANFRIDSSNWSKFKDKAIANSSNATAELNKFIAAYVVGNVDLGDGIDSLDSRIGDVVENECDHPIAGKD